MRRTESREPGGAARAKPRRKVAVMLQLWQNFDRRILRGIGAFVRERHNWSVFVEEVEHQRIPDLKEWDGDGLIVNFDSRSVARAIRGIAKPVVGLGGGRGWHEERSGIPYVATDDAAIGRLAAEHLLDRGLRQFAFCGYPRTPTNVWVAGRLEGFRGRLAEAGCECRIYNGRHTTAVHWSRIQQELTAWLRTLPRPVGLLGCYDYRARHVLEACKAAGLRVPDDVAVVGVDNDAICDLCDPPLTSVEQGCVQIGYTAATLLDTMMAGHKPRQLRYVIPPVGLVARASTDLIYVADRDVAEALKWLREEACRGLQADAVAERLGLSRGTLDKRFKQAIGRTADQEIRRVRLARAKELLIRTNLPTREIARQSGYGNEQYLHAVLRQDSHTTPARYRAAHRTRD